MKLYFEGMCGPRKDPTNAFSDNREPTAPDILRYAYAVAVHADKREVDTCFNPISVTTMTRGLNHIIEYSLFMYPEFVWTSHWKMKASK